MGVYGRAGKSVVHFLSTISQVTARLKRNVILKPSATDANCWMLHVAPVCTPCCMLLSVVGSCCAKFETGQTFNTKIPYRLPQNWLGGRLFHCEAF